MAEAVLTGHVTPPDQALFALATSKCVRSHSRDREVPNGKVVVE